MATRLYYRGPQGSASVDIEFLAANGTQYTNLLSAATTWANFTLRTAIGSGTNAFSIDTVAGPTAGIEASAFWGASAAISPPLSIDVTISGTINCNLWGLESAMAANATLGCRILRLTSAGVFSVIGVGNAGTELGTSAAVRNFNITPTSTAFNRGDRIVVIPHIDDATGLNMGSGETVTFQYGGGAGSNYETWVEFTETLTFESAPSGTTVYPTTTDAGINPGSATEYETWTSRGSGATTAATNTVAGWASPVQATLTGGGTAVEWYTRPLGAVTLQGPILISVRCLTDNAVSGAGVRAEIAVTDGDGANPVVYGVGGAATDPDTTQSTRQFWVAGDSISVTTGQRIRLRLLIDDAGGGSVSGGDQMASGHSVTFYFAGASGGSGDTYLTFPVTLTEPTVSASFTIDAVLRSTSTTSFTIDAVIVRLISASFAADAVLKRTYGVSLTIDAVLFRAQTSSFTTDAVISPPSVQEDFTADAILLRTMAGGPFDPGIFDPAVFDTAFGIVFKAILRRGQSASLSIDAVIGGGGGFLTIDSVLLRTEASSFTLNSIIKVTQTVSLTADAVLRRGISGSFTADAVISEAGLAGCIFDPAIFDPIVFDVCLANPIFTLNAVLFRTQSSSFTLDSVIRRTESAQAFLDASIRRIESATVTLDAVTKRIESAAFTLDAVIESGVVTDSFTLDAVLFRTTEASLTLDAVIAAVSVNDDFVLDAILMPRATLDAVLLRAPSIGATLNAIVLRATSASFTLDSLFISFLGNFGLNTVIKRTQAAQFTVRAFIVNGDAEAGETAPHPIIRILVDGVEVTPDVIFVDASFTMLVNGGIGQFSFRVRDIGKTLDFTTGAEVTLDINGVRRFGGYLTNVSRLYTFPAVDTSDLDRTQRFWRLSGVDYNVLFAKRILYNKTTPADVSLRSWPTGSASDTVIRYIVDNYTDLLDDGVVTDGVENVGSPNPDRIGVIASGGLTLGNAMREINRLIGGVWYIDPYKQLVYTDVDTPNASRSLSDRPAGGTEVGYREFTHVENGAGLVNDAMVWGAGQGQPRITFGRTQDPTSQAVHGLWQFGEFTTALYRQASVNQRARTIVFGTAQNKRGGKDDQVSWTVTTFDHHFSVGQKATIESEVFGVTDVVPIRRMTINFPTTQDPRYQLILSHEIDEPWNMFEFFFPPWPDFDFDFDFDIPPFDLPSHECTDEDHFGAQGCQEVIDDFENRTLAPSTTTDAWGTSATGPAWFTNPGGRWSVHDGEGWFERATDDPNSPSQSIVSLSALNNASLLLALNEQEVLLYGEFYLPAVIDLVEDAIEGTAITGGILGINLDDATKSAGGAAFIHTGSPSTQMIDVSYTDHSGGPPTPNDATLVNWLPGRWYWGLYLNRLTGLIEFGVQQNTRPLRPFPSSFVASPTEIPQSFTELSLHWIGPKITYEGGAIETPVDPRIAFDNIEVDGCVVVLAQYDCRSGDDMTFIRTVEGTSQNTGGSSTFAFFGNIGTNDATDWLVASIRLFAASGVTCATPSGWSAHPDNGHSMVTATTTTLWMFCKLSSGDPNEDVTFTFSGATKYSANVESLRGASGTVGGFAKSSSSGTVINLGVISAPINKHLALFGCGAIDTFATLTKDAGVDVFTASSMPSPEGPNLRMLTGYADYDFPSQYIEAHDISGTLSVAASMIGLTIAFTQSAGCLFVDCDPIQLDGSARSDETGTGAQTVFQLPVAFIAGSTRVFVNGIFQRPGSTYEYTESAALGRITFATAPPSGATVTIFYEAFGSL